MLASFGFAVDLPLCPHDGDTVTPTRSSMYRSAVMFSAEKRIFMRLFRQKTLIRRVYGFINLRTLITASMWTLRRRRARTFFLFEGTAYSYGEVYQQARRYAEFFLAERRALVDAGELEWRERLAVGVYMETPPVHLRGARGGAEQHARLCCQHGVPRKDPHDRARRGKGLAVIINEATRAEAQKTLSGGAPLLRADRDPLRRTPRRRLRLCGWRPLQPAVRAGVQADRRGGTAWAATTSGRPSSSTLRARLARPRGSHARTRSSSGRAGDRRGAPLACAGTIGAMCVCHYFTPMPGSSASCRSSSPEGASSSNVAFRRATPRGGRAYGGGNVSQLCRTAISPLRDRRRASKKKNLARATPSRVRSPGTRITRNFVLPTAMARPSSIGGGPIASILWHQGARLQIYRLHRGRHHYGQPPRQSIESVGRAGASVRILDERDQECENAVLDSAGKS